MSGEVFLSGLGEPPDGSGPWSGGGPGLGWSRKGREAGGGDRLALVVMNDNPDGR